MKVITKFMIGLKCQKRAKPKGSSPKPFKSSFKYNTVKGLAINPYSGNYALTFEEDDSIVDFNEIVLLDDALLEIHKEDISRQIRVHKNRAKLRKEQENETAQ